ncbi:BrnT family toxin [Myxacorys almedinensis]|uniref:BrnT family toxin n=1 Tax=Myxacorys almedinensis A TaxID=2690445 RepID=A0A8J8CI47_9CYAN|nr:BrnT family toxin [Myxacorys almedinensis]NDJ17359.1 BrnT family toxin [Myxacorys almedinensis A]
MLFEWDDDKDRQNFRKHGICFEEARAIFDGIVFTRLDERFDYGETREISIGAIQGVVIIVVVHTERNDVIRIISARLATRKERKEYYDYLTRET